MKMLLLFLLVLVSCSNPNEDGSGTTTFSIDLPFVSEELHVKVEVMNSYNTVVKKLFEGKLTPNRYSFQWDGSDNKGNKVPEGIYYYKVTYNKHTYLKLFVMVS